MKNLLRVEDLMISVPSNNGQAFAVSGISFEIAAGSKVAIVGESGSGKSLTGLAIMRLLKSPVKKVSGKIFLQEIDSDLISEEEFRKYRGGEVAMIYQDPMSSLNPIVRIGKQIVESILIHESLSKASAKERAFELLTKVGITDTERVFNSYPFEMSGGMLQRAMIAMSLSGSPQLLIADEATTALDVTTQARVLALLDSLAIERNLTIILITHDLGVAAQFADEVIVMYAGKIMEQGSVERIFSNPIHPYTRGLLDSRCDQTIDTNKPIKSISGQPPNPGKIESKCSFASRCEHAIQICLERQPTLELSKHGRIACFRTMEFVEDGLERQ
jgi:oligopeptide/dipeptide ABC transporter ATP-binding protein